MVPSLLSVGSLAATHPFHPPFYFVFSGFGWLVVASRRGWGVFWVYWAPRPCRFFVEICLSFCCSCCFCRAFSKATGWVARLAASFRLLLRSGFVPYFLFPVSLAYSPFVWLSNFNLFPFSSLSLMSPKTAAIFVQSGVSYSVTKDVIAAWLLWAVESVCTLGLERLQFCACFKELFLMGLLNMHKTIFSACLLRPCFLTFAAFESICRYLIFPFPHRLLNAFHAVLLPFMSNVCFFASAWCNCFLL
jgi:hypothetical protein